MFAPSRIRSSFGCLAALAAAALAPAPVAAGDWQRGYLEPAIQAWMGVVTLLAEDGEREEKHERRGRSEREDGDDDKDGDDRGRGECKGDCDDK